MHDRRILPSTDAQLAKDCAAGSRVAWDELYYESLKPGDADAANREFIDPARVHAALADTPPSVKEAVARLHGRLGAHKVVIIGLSRPGDTITIHCEPYDAATAAPTGAPIDTTATETTLAGEMRKAAYGAVALGRKGPK